MTLFSYNLLSKLPQYVNDLFLKHGKCSFVFENIFFLQLLHNNGPTISEAKKKEKKYIYSEFWTIIMSFCSHDRYFILKDFIYFGILKKMTCGIIVPVGYKYSLFFVPRFREKISFVRPSVPLSVLPSLRLSVTKTLTWLISSEVLKIEHWYLACMILVTSPFKWYHAVTLTLTFDLLQGQIVAGRGTTILRICLFFFNYPR